MEEGVCGSREGGGVYWAGNEGDRKIRGESEVTKDKRGGTDAEEVKRET